MILKRWKLVYITVFIKILVAMQNTSNSHKENNIEMHDVEHYTHYNSIEPEYPRLQLHENKIYTYETDNNTMMQESFTTRTPTHQYKPFISGYSEPQQPRENEVWGYGSYKDPVTWEYCNTGIPATSEPEKMRGQEEIKTSTVEQLVTEFRRIEQNLSIRKQLLLDEHNRRIDKLIRESGTGEPNTSLVEHSIVEFGQTNQNTCSEMQPSVDEYSRRIAEIIEEQEAAELSRLVGNLEEMPMQESTEEYRPYDMPEQSHSLLVTQSIEDSPYEYSNSTFLYNFLYSPSSFITADAIRIRFSGLFLSFLSSEQVIRVLIVLLENKLGLSNEDQKEFIEIMFGHIDYSLDLVITKTQVVMLVEAIMRSNVSDYFEQVFLTWKMWYNFTVEDQEKMLKDAKREHKREILVMLYLFVINRDDINSQQCEIFKNVIKTQYKEIGVLKDGHTLTDVVIMMDNRNVEVLRIILNTFDTCLLDLPEVFKNIDENVLTIFCKVLKFYFFSHHQNAKPRVLKYKSHVCYALTKFTQEFKQANSTRESNDVESNSRSYFDLVYVKCEFANWIRMLKKNNNSVISTISVDEREKQFVNAFAMIRQITQSNEYNSDMFFKLFNKVDTRNIYDKPYLILLFSLTNENILRDLKETQEWTEYMKKRFLLTDNYRFIEGIFMNNASLNPELYISLDAKACLVKICEFFSKLNTKRGLIMHREYYFYRHLLFYPRSSIFNGMYMSSYIEGLSKIGLLNSKEQCDQIARDLVFSEYYHEAAIELSKSMLEKFEMVPGLVEFKKSIKKELEIHKNEEAIEKERVLFRKC